MVLDEVSVGATRSKNLVIEDLKKELGVSDESHDDCLTESTPVIMREKEERGNTGGAVWQCGGQAPTQ